MLFDPEFVAAARRVLLARYSPAELRVPAGQPGGGQWTNGGAQSPKLAAAIARVGEEIRGLKGREELVFLDADGNEIFRKGQKGYAVPVSDAQLELMKGAVAIHNHPRGWEKPADDPGRAGSSFSADDVALAVNGLVGEMRVVSPGYDFVLKRPASGWPSTLWAEEAHLSISNTVAAEFNDRIRSGYAGWGEDEASRIAHANAEHSHEVMTRLANLAHWDYSRTLHAAPPAVTGEDWAHMPAVTH